ncbi:MAG: hypothetical protein RIG26_14920 [Thalassospira sp.]|uniref:hypothetical protein n=1 Tax=Thalassospira sp. TaxID=1912094 RepID=UPI0032EED97B
MIYRLACALILLIISPSIASDLAGAAQRLKQDAVAKTWNDCKAMGLPDTRCKGLISTIHRHELSIITEMKEIVDKNQAEINGTRISKEMASCAGGDYQAMVNCQGRLLDRLKAAISGNTLISGDQ